MNNDEKNGFEYAWDKFTRTVLLAKRDFKTSEELIIFDNLVKALFERRGRIIEKLKGHKL